ncbi:hypothetical protein BJF85_02825 [Saccharomonospora sp. CUA-673]|uniref:hypothetical protein n=1 Tax=Saccharomonospora sp. CUA-673 TaxID=1904969 RepID=UPI000965A754|nr:hypothetical protein [Saccharomonospora sp. CUA-673]OLT43052.1 hypothetical protein BJF85_02825 [Saccharomonospora sp. CUA-673]
MSEWQQDPFAVAEHWPAADRDDLAEHPELWCWVKDGDADIKPAHRRRDASQVEALEVALREGVAIRSAMTVRGMRTTALATEVDRGERGGDG